MVGLCRLCASLRKADVLITIQDDFNEICEKLRHCCQLSITIADALPKSICQECLEHLDISHKFYLKVKEAQETLQALYPFSTKDPDEEDVKSHTAALVKSLSVAGKGRKSILSLENQIKIKEPQDKANENNTNSVELTKTIKLEDNVDTVVKNSRSSRPKRRKSSSPPLNKQKTETLTYLEEVCNMLDMTKEEIVLDNSYEILDTLDEANDDEEILADEEILEDEEILADEKSPADKECENTKYEYYETDDEQSNQHSEIAKDSLEEDYRVNIKVSSDFKEGLADTGIIDLKGINVEMEYIEDDECNEEVHSCRDDKNKFNQIKTPPYISPELQFKSWKAYSYLCYLCDSKTSSFVDLKKHIEAEHDISHQNIQYKCYDCQKIIPRYNFFLNHIRIKHHPGLKLRCEACDLSCQNFEELSHHRSVNCAEAKNYENLIPCNLCYKSFSNNFGLQYHQRSKHEVGKIQLKYQCVQCGKQFQNKMTLKTHERSHTGGNKFVCEICQKIYTSKLGLDQHLLFHVSDKTYKCNICNKSFSSFMTLDQHQYIHNNEKPFKCEYCDKSFRKKIEKNTHERVHTGEMPFQCEQCDKRFRFRSAFNAHMKIHTGVKPYACGYCDKIFAESSNRNKHVRRIHPNGQKKKKI